MPETLPKLEWYAAAVMDGEETQVARAIQKQVRIYSLERLVSEILVPQASFTKLLNGKRSLTQEPLFEGYLLIRMRWVPELYYLLKSVQDFYTLLPTTEAPLSIPGDEIAAARKLERAMRKEAKEVKIRFNVGDVVEVTAGAFKGALGRVLEFDEAYPGAQPTVSVELVILGSKVPVVVYIHECKRA